jgi:hypothetical protein
MVKIAGLGSVADAHSAKEDFAAMEAIAQADLAWLPTADLPEVLHGPYKTLLSNIDLNAARLVDGSKDGYFVFLGSRLAPLWRKDIDKVRALALGSQ